MTEPTDVYVLDEPWTRQRMEDMQRAVLHPDPVVASPEGRERLAHQIDRAETILSTPGVSSVYWDEFVPGEDELAHLAYLQHIAELDEFGLEFPADIADAVRVIRRWRRR